MAEARGNIMRLKVQQHSSGTVNEYIGTTTSFDFTSSAELLDTTSGGSGLDRDGIQGLVSRTISGEYILATNTDSFNNLYTHQENGTVIEWEIERSDASWKSGTAVITSLGFNAGTAANLLTGSFTLEVVGTVTSA